MWNKASYSIQWDELYITGGLPTMLPVSLENAKQLITSTRCLGDMSVFSNAGNVVYLAYWDTKVTGPLPTPAQVLLSDQRLLDVVPLSGPGFFQFSVHGGIDLTYGLWAGAYTTAALALAGGAPDAGNVLFYKVHYGVARWKPIK